MPFVRSLLKWLVEFIRECLSIGDADSHVWLSDVCGGEAAREKARAMSSAMGRHELVYDLAAIIIHKGARNKSISDNFLESNMLFFRHRYCVWRALSCLHKRYSRSWVRLTKFECTLEWYLTPRAA